jgi:hypothetical protein
MMSIILPGSLYVHRHHPGKQQHLPCEGPSIGCSLWNKLTKLRDASNRSAHCNRRLRLVTVVPAELDMHHEITAEQRKCKHVSFNMEANHIHLSAALVDPTDESIPAIELWWSSEEMNSSHWDGKLDAVVKESVQEYRRAFERAHRQVHTARKLTTANLGDVVKGLALGYQGLEQYSTFTTQRKKAIRNHVLSVIAFQRDSKSGSDFLGLDDSSHRSCSGSSSSTVNTHSTTRHVKLERMVRYHSAKLSAGDRHFAAAMGKAHHMAATRADDEKHD